jgi:hypothetical protein
MPDLGTLDACWDRAWRGILRVVLLLTVSKIPALNVARLWHIRKVAGIQSASVGFGGRIAKGRAAVSEMASH